MKPLSIVAALVISTGIHLLPVGAQLEVPPPPAAESAPAKLPTLQDRVVLKGAIDSVESDSIHLQHYANGAIVAEKIVVTPDTLITLNGQQTTLADLQPGYLARALSTKPTDPFVADVLDCVCFGTQEERERARQIIPVLFAAGGGGGGGIGNPGPGPGPGPGPDSPPTCVILPCGLCLPCLGDLLPPIELCELIDGLLSCLPELEGELLCQLELAEQLIGLLLETADGKLDLATSLLIAKLEHLCNILEFAIDTTDATLESVQHALIGKLRTVRETLQVLLTKTGKLPEALLSKLCLDLRDAADLVFKAASKLKHLKLDNLHQLARALKHTANCVEGLIGLPIGNLIEQKQQLIGALLGAIGPCDSLISNLVGKLDPVTALAAQKLRHLAGVLQATLSTATGALDQLHSKLIADLLGCADVLELLAVAADHKLELARSLVSHKLAATAETLKGIVGLAGDGIGGLKSLLIHKLEWASKCVLQTGAGAVTKLTSALSDVGCLCGLLQGDLVRDLLTAKHALIAKLLHGAGALDPSECSLLSQLIRIDTDLSLDLRMKLADALLISGDLTAELRLDLARILAVDVDLQLLSDVRLCEILTAGGTLDAELSIRLAQLLCSDGTLDVNARITLARLLQGEAGVEVAVGNEAWLGLLVSLQVNLESGESLAHLARTLKSCALDLAGATQEWSAALLQEKIALVEHLLHAACLCDQLAGLLHVLDRTGEKLDLQHIHRTAQHLLAALHAALRDCDKLDGLAHQVLGKAVQTLRGTLQTLTDVVGDLCLLPQIDLDSALTKLHRVVHDVKTQAGLLVFQTIGKLDFAHDLLAHKLGLAGDLAHLAGDLAAGKLADLKRELGQTLHQIADAGEDVVRLLKHKLASGDDVLDEALVKAVLLKAELLSKAAGLCDAIAALTGNVGDCAETLLGRKLRVVAALLTRVVETGGQTLGSLQACLTNLLPNCLPHADGLIAVLVSEVGQLKADVLRKVLHGHEGLDPGSRLEVARLILGHGQEAVGERLELAIACLLDGELTSELKQAVGRLLREDLLSGAGLQHALLETLEKGTQLDLDARGLVAHLLCGNGGLSLDQLSLLCDVLRLDGPLTESLRSGLEGILAAKISDSLANTQLLLTGSLHEAFAQHHVIEGVTGIITDKAPPLPLSELIPQLKGDDTGLSWISGYWNYNDLNDSFEWVSGIYRRAPPGRKWMDGGWQKVDGMFVRVPGAWVPEGLDLSNLKFLPQLPAKVVGESVDLSKTAGKLWVAGQWVFEQGKYVWKDGQWISGSESWVWTPPVYLLTDKGTLLIDGFWDRPFNDRGIIFPTLELKSADLPAPVYHLARAAILPERLLLHLFSREDRSGYLFGNFYDPHFADQGVLAWFKTPGSDHLLAHEAARMAQKGINLLARLENWHKYFLENPHARPPRTLEDLITFASNNAGNPYAAQSLLVTDLQTLAWLDTQKLALSDGLLNSSQLGGTNLLLGGNLLGSTLNSTLSLLGSTTSLLNLNSTVGSLNTLTNNLLGGVNGLTGNLNSSLGGVTGNIGGISNTLGSTTSSLGGVTSTVGGLTNTVGGLTNTVGGVTGTVGGVTGTVGGVTGTIGGLTGGLLGGP